ncbi:M20/M25/M40 family metallo-hydrolase [Candidatus Woesebacteria bacterium]|nr:M20/M25/M40 family metallo-hydrolase [Candidatus Woesebacteria bacterium]
MKTTVFNELQKFVSIPSVSTDPARTAAMSEAVVFLKKKLESLHFAVEILENGGSPPLVFAQLIIPKAKTSIGIYGHYDVQPEDPIGKWKSPPFELTARDGKLYGRGVADNKGHIIQNIAAIEELLVRGELKSSITFLLEGEEECGSGHLEKYIEKKHVALAKVDVFFVTDEDMHAKNVPQIIYALRGLIYFEVQVTIGNIDLHSGVYGNAVHNPAQVLSDLFAALKDSSTGEVLIDGFYDDVRQLDEEELALLEKGAVTQEAFQNEMEAHGSRAFRGQSTYLAPKIFPSLDIHGLHSGFTGEGTKTVIPRKARAKFSCRLVENQEGKKMNDLVVRFIENYFAARYQSADLSVESPVRYSITTHAYDDPFYCSIDDPYIQKTAQILTEHFGNETIFMRDGGSIPVAEIIQRILDKPVVLTGFVLPDSALHAPNENFDEEMFYSGIEALQKVYSSLENV